LRNRRIGVWLKARGIAKRHGRNRPRLLSRKFEVRLQSRSASAVRGPHIASIRCLDQMKLLAAEQSACTLRRRCDSFQNFGRMWIKRCNTVERVAPSKLERGVQLNCWPAHFTSDNLIPNSSEKSVCAVVAFFHPLSKWPSAPSQITPQPPS
jgi:hypothetical protein